MKKLTEKKFSIKFSKVRTKSLHQKFYFQSPGISRKAQAYQENIIFPSTLWIKNRPYFRTPKSSKQEFFSNQ